MMVFPADHSGRLVVAALVLAAVLMGLLAAAVLPAGDTARAQDPPDPPEPTTHQITRGTSDAALQESLDAVFASTGATLAAVKAGDIIEFSAGVYEDIGRASGFYLWLDKANLTVRGARDPRLGQASGQCDSSTDTILTGSSGFELRASGITVEHFCFQNINDGSSAHANPHNLHVIRAQNTADGFTIRRNRIDNTIGGGVFSTFTAGELNNVTIGENEFIDIGLIASNAAGTAIQPRHSGKEPSAIHFQDVWSSNYRIDDNLFEGSAWVGVIVDKVTTGTISGNTFRNMAKSAVELLRSTGFTLDDNTFEGNNRAAWRVVHSATWMNDLRFGLSGRTVGVKSATMESAALQNFLRSTKVQAVEMGMDGDLYDLAVASRSESVYRDPQLYAAVLIAASPSVTISNSTFTNNHNSIAICGHAVCRVDGLEAVGDAGDTGRSPAYISPSTYPFSDDDRIGSTVTLNGNQFKSSDTRSFDGPGSIGNHLVIGYHRANFLNKRLGPAAGSFNYQAGNSFSGSGVVGGAAASTVSTISLDPESAEFVEGTGAVFTLTIAPAPSANLTVHYSVSEVGSGVVGTLPDDFPAIDGAQITVASGSTSAVLTIPTADSYTAVLEDSITVTIEPGFYLSSATATVFTLGGPETHEITRGDTDSELQTSLNTVFGSDGATLDAVEAGDTIKFGPGEYEDIGRKNGFYLRIDKDNLTVRGARDPRLAKADGECDPTTDTILTGSSGFELRAAGITVEQICFEDIDDGSSAHASPHNLAPILAQKAANGATVRRNRIDTTIGMGLNGRISASGLDNLTITENEFIDIGLIENNGAGTAIQPRHTGQEPSAIQLDTLRQKDNLTVTDNLFEGSAWAALSLAGVQGGTISGNTFRNIAKSAVLLDFSPDFTLDDNTYEGNNRAAWRVVRTADWLNDGTYGISGVGTLTTGTKRATMESEALQTLMRLTKEQAVAEGMDGDLYDAAADAAADTIYRDPDLHAAVRVSASARVTISDSTFSDNHNSIAICGDTLCRVEGLETVGDDGDTGRAPAYITPTTFPSGGTSRLASTVTVAGNRFHNSDSRSFDGPGSVGNHLVIGYHRDASTTNEVGPAAGSITDGTGNRFSGSGVLGGAAPFWGHPITRGDTNDELQTSLNTVWASGGATLAAVKSGDTIEFGPGLYVDIGRASGGFYLQLDKEGLTVRGASDPRLGEADGQCDPTTDTIFTGSSGFELRAENITVEQICFQDIDDGSLAHANPHHLGAILVRHDADGATIRRNRIDNTIGMGVNGRIGGSSNLSEVTIVENEFIDIGLIGTNGAGTAIQPRHTGQEPSAIQFDTGKQKDGYRINDNLFDGSAWVGVSLVNSPRGSINGNTFRNMAKSAVYLVHASSLTLDKNTFEGNNHTAWRVVETADWLNDLKFGLALPEFAVARTGGSKTATMESEALQTLLRMTKVQAVAAGMDADLFDAATENTVYRDPGLHAAVRVSGSSGITISNSTFTNNHNSIAVCARFVCRVDGLETVGDDGDTGRAPAYISPATYPGGAHRFQSNVTLRGNQFNNSDTRRFDGPGSIGNHLVIGYYRRSLTNNLAGPAVGSFNYGAGNSFTGSGVRYGGAAGSAISIKSASAEVYEGEDAVFNLTFAPAARTDLTVHYSVSEVGSFAGTLPDDDPALPGTQIAVAAGVTSAVLTIPTVSDPTVDPDGSITVTIEPGESYRDGATATVDIRDGSRPIVVAAPPPIFIPPPPPFRKDEVAVVDGAARLEANKVVVDLVEGSLPENVVTVEATVTKLSRSKTPEAPDGGRFSIPSNAAFEIELEATLADETTQPLTELAAPATVCLPIPRRVDNPVVLRHEAESEEWVKLAPAPSSEEDQACAFTASISVYAVADEADHLEGLSANEINDFSVWEADYPLTASELLAALLDVNPIWVRNDETWTGYATFEGEPIPGAVDFPIANGDTLWLGSVGSGGDTDEEDEEDEG